MSEIARKSAILAGIGRQFLQRHGKCEGRLWSDVNWRPFKPQPLANVSYEGNKRAADLRADPERERFKTAPRQFPDEVERIRIDTYVGMAFSNLVALAIIVTTAATLHVRRPRLGAATPRAA